MKATIYKIHDRLGVAYLTDGENEYVAECICGTDVQVIPQSMRQIESVYDAEAEVSDNPTAQDILNRMLLRVRRLRDRLEEFQSDDVSDGEPRDLILESIACRDELNALIQRFTLARL